MRPEARGGADGTIAGLPGASPDASTSVSIMLELLRRGFPDRWEQGWSAARSVAIPALADDAVRDTATVDASTRATARALHLRGEP